MGAPRAVNCHKRAWIRTNTISIRDWRRKPPLRLHSTKGHVR
jgi:hypothetical protein